MIDIRDISGRIKLSVSIGSSSLHRFELMKEDYISIVFSLETPGTIGDRQTMWIMKARFII